ncbi:MAG: Gfo/Idh/MocA family protein [Promethearchaeota archaeon]
MASHKCAVLGVGGRGNDHVNWLLRYRDAEVVAVCDINEDLARKQVEKVEEKQQTECRAYRDYTELLDEESIDAAFIASPHYMHAPMTIAAAQHDVNVFCEKPMAVNLKQADDMIVACRLNDVKLAIGLQKRYVPEFQYLHDAVNGASGDRGDLGRITDVYMTARHYRGEMYYLTSAPVDPATGVPPGPWRGRWDTEGAGVLINQAVHNIDVFRWVVGPIRSLTAYGATISNDHKFIEVEDTVTACMELENGAVATLVVTSSNPKDCEANRIVVHGTRGYVEASGGYAGEMIRHDSRYENEEDYDIPWTMEMHERDQVENFFHALDHDHDPKVTGEVGRQSIEVVRAILKSIQSEGPVRFPLKDSFTPFVPNRNRAEWDPGF